MPDPALIPPTFGRLTVHRRVLGSVTAEHHAGLGPRNTAETLTVFLEDDPHTALAEPVQEYLDDLEASGLVTQVSGVYELTEVGVRELAH